jgi:probable rRNA maturation factor
MRAMSLPQLEIEVQVDAGFKVDAAGLRRATLATLRQQGMAGSVALALVVTGDGPVRRLNRTYRGVDAPTDVLAFGYEGEGGLGSEPTMPRYLGDVIISFPRAEAQAQRAGHPVEAELQLLTIHGVLHLLGHDHAEPEEKAAMWSAQAQILRDLGTSVSEWDADVREPPLALPARARESNAD